jgi:integrase/recombinase XerD
VTSGSSLGEIAAPRQLPSGGVPALFLKQAGAAERSWYFFSANIRNPHTGPAYYNAARGFAEFCGERGVLDLARVKPAHVAAYVESLRGNLAKPTIKQHLAAIRKLFDRLVVGQIVDVNPPHAVRGPKHILKKGRDASPEPGGGAHAARLHRYGHTDRPARPGAYRRDDLHLRPHRRGWLRLHERGGKDHQAPWESKLEAYLDAYIAAAGIADDKERPLWRTTGRSTGIADRMTQQDVHRMIRRRAHQAGIETAIENHSLHAIGITDYMKSEGTFEYAQLMAAHSSPSSAELYDRRSDETALDE